MSQVLLSYFHGSYEPLDVGTNLVSQENGSVQQASAELEQLFERCRPEGMISRRQAVFLVANVCDVDPAGGYTDHIYRVKPVQEAQMHDLAWYTQAQVFLNQEKPDKAEECAHAYWRGEPHPVREWSLPEYLTRLAEVVEEVDEEPAAPAV